MPGIESRVSALIEAIRSRDRVLGKELQDKRGHAGTRDEADRIHPVLESALAGSESVSPRLALETIVLRTGRPVLAVAHDEPHLDFQEADSEVWRERLAQARDRLIPAIRAVGRIELEHHPRFAWIGTGWLLRPDVIVTNRHVALEFGQRRQQGFVFRAGTGGQQIDASIDFLEELTNDRSRTFRLRKILSIEDDDGPDLAFIGVDGAGLHEPIALSSRSLAKDQMVAVIGYPARDSRLPDQQLMDQVFANAYDAKRLAPGQIVKAGDKAFEHDCSTLGGNSGSVVLDLATGEALGIHFAGRFLEANFGVASPLLHERLDHALRNQPRRVVEVPKPGSQVQPMDQPALDRQQPGGAASMTVTIPICITVDVGPVAAGRAQAVSVVVAPADPRAPVVAGPDEDEILEGVPDQYIGRSGYQSAFLGTDFAVPLPRVVRDSDQVVDFEFSGESERELRYQHFSVVMNRSRRMCFFSAVNVDGKQSRRAKRSSWRIDPRIAKELQIMHECYGSPPKFSRGHMTRREDPVWGSEAEAGLGNDDSMHVTNVVPQMQAFNAPIWLGLENYALGNARRDAMRISVITGPVLLAGDPLRYGVRIPLSFWKVIAFIHDETGELCVTGYSISQLASLPVEEHIFGGYETYQRPLAWIEQQAGLSFGDLASADPLRDAEESLASPLGDLAQIRFSQRRIRLE